MDSKRYSVRHFVSNNRYLLLSISVVLIYLSPNIFFPHLAHFLIHDNLNSNVVWYKNLSESGKFFSANQEIVPNSLGGLPRGCYPSELNFLHLFYLIFSPLVAYNLNIVIMHLIAFYGMFMFAKTYFFARFHISYAYAIALIFALLPFWPSGGLSIVGQPLLLYAFLNIYNNNLNVKNWLIIAVLPFYSVLVFSNFFLMIILTLVFFILCSIRKQLSIPTLVAFALFVFMSVVSEHKLFEMQFIEKFESHRDLSSKTSNLNLLGLIGISLKHFFKSQYHFYSVNVIITLALCVLAFFVGKEKREKLILLGLIFLAYIISVFFVLPQWNSFRQLVGKLTILEGINLRFYSVFPILWICILSFASQIILKYFENYAKPVLLVAFTSLMLINLFSYKIKDYQGSKFVENSFYKTLFDNSNEESMAFDSYYKSAFFKTIKQKIIPESFYIATIGIEPEILQYNGYNTIDGYFYYYPKSYNTLMISISKKEMQKSNITSIGSHCNIVCDDLNRGKRVINSLELNFELMKQIGTKYIFSDRKITSPNLINEQYFRRHPNEIYIYTLK